MTIFNKASQDSSTSFKARSCDQIEDVGIDHPDTPQASGFQKERQHNWAERPLWTDRNSPTKRAAETTHLEADP